MKKVITLSLAAAISVFAAEVELAPIGVESTLITEVAQNAQTSADVAEALSDRVPSIDMNRRSGIANDIYIRGQKRDNISIEVDGTKVQGACPNRMDPPTSHILANQIDEVKVTEGPYDVETFGVMSGGVKITTKKPTKEFQGSVDLGYGSWDYKKAGVTLSGGNDTVRVLVTGSTESSEQYKDGDGNTLSQQLKNNPAAVANNNVYQTKHENMDAYEKKSVMAKAFVTITDDQELRLSYTGNRSDNIMYPSSSMDAIYDDSNIYSIEYNIANLTNSYKNLNLKYYYSDVDHPMSTEYRKSGVMMKMVSKLQTEMKGLKLKNDFDFDGTKVTLGLDASKRVWDGKYYLNDNLMTGPTQTSTSINNAVTKNKAIFAKAEKRFGNLNVKAGVRYDWTSISTNDTSMQNNDYNALNANIFTTYNLNTKSNIFLGLGQASRVPDARELYFKKNKVVSTMPTVWSVVTQGNDTLKDTTNREVDFGYELKDDAMNFKVKGFYSDLKDYIYFDGDTFTNIDAKVYGAELSSEFFVTDNLTVDAGASYKKGKKDNALATQTDTDLADMAPARANIGATYEYANNSTVSAEVVMSDSWDNYDSDNGEQKLAGWSVLNLKAKHAFGKTVELTLGVNNLFDATYAQSNTYVDLTLLTAGTDTMLLNEPGRYLYTNLTYKF